MTPEEQKRLLEATEAMQDDTGNMVVTENLDDILLDEDGGIDLQPIPSGLADKDGNPIYLKVRAKPTQDPSVIASYVANETKNKVQAYKDLINATVLKPDPKLITDDARWNRYSPNFKDTLVTQLLRLEGIDGFFEKFRLVARPELVRAAIRSSTASRKPTDSRRAR